MSGIEALAPADRELVQAALAASANAYAPYSGFAVGAALRTRAGAMHTGANLENASYGLGICAEMSAIAAANAAGALDLEAIAVVGHKFTAPPDANQIVTPCGRCRQIIFEASQLSGVDIRVLSSAGGLRRVEIAVISSLLPAAFGPANLGVTDSWLDLRKLLQDRVRALQLQGGGPRSD
jgi:cytidine deaminase